jgi:hypothetical protein
MTDLHSDSPAKPKTICFIATPEIFEFLQYRKEKEGRSIQWQVTRYVEAGIKRDSKKKVGEACNA